MPPDLPNYPPAHSNSSKVGTSRPYPLISGRRNKTMTVQVIPKETEDLIH